VQTLSHFSAAVADEHRAINVNVDKGARLVQELGSEGDAKFSWQNADSFLLPTIFSTNSKIRECSLWLF